MRKNVRFAVLLFILSLLSAGSGCTSKPGRRGDGRPVAVVTFPQQAALLRPLVGDEYEIVVLLPPGTDPETYEPSMSTMKALTRADVYFTMGSPGFEEAVLRGVRENFPDLTVIDASEGIERLRDTHGHAHSHGHDHGHDHDESHDHDHGDSGHGHEAADQHGHSSAGGHGHEAGDPHLLTSVRNGRKMAANMATGLSRLNYSKAGVYTQRLSRLDSTLRIADDSLASMFAGGASAFVVKHPSLSYFANDYHLNQIALEEEGKEPSPRRYRETLSRIETSCPAIVISEKQHSSRNLEAAAEMMQVPVVEVDLNTEGWIETLFLIAGKIQKSPSADKGADKCANKPEANHSHSHKHSR